MTERNIQVICCQGKIPSPAEFYYRPDVMIESCQKFGFTPIILGTKEGDWKGLGSKAKLMKRALYDGTITSDYVIFCDIFDILFVRSPADIVEQFLVTQQTSPAMPSIIWNGETACFPDEGRAERHPKTNSRFRYLNSGFSVGEVEGFKKFYAESDPDLILDDHQDSQGVWRFDHDQRHALDYFLDGSLSMMLDTECKICQSLFQTTPEEFDFSGEYVRNIALDSTPMTIHANGNSKDNGMFNLFLRHYGYRESRPQ